MTPICFLALLFGLLCVLSAYAVGLVVGSSRS
jgi:hypothetical protein